jgi:geranylgeranyl diphosphate synthase type I
MSINATTSTAEMTTALEETLRNSLLRVDTPILADYRHMLAYHLGWEGEGAGPEASGKRIRPLLTLLTCAAARGDWRDALPAAAAVELVHNFSLIHDDIQDHSPLRRGRRTVWNIWGVAQAINAGDAMFTLAHLTLLHLEHTCSPEIVLQASTILHQACLELTQGQFLDLAFETNQDVSIDDYWRMVSGKTAALLAAATELGALVAETDPASRQAYRQFGHALGLAFQAQDDILGIWGDAALTGKSSESDLLSGKKSLPVIFALNREGDFARRWQQGRIQPEEVHDLASLLEREGARAFAEEQARLKTEQSLQALHQARPQEDYEAILRSLALRLLRRDG